jgi:hypothetical protein
MSIPAFLTSGFVVVTHCLLPTGIRGSENTTKKSPLPWEQRVGVSVLSGTAYAAAVCTLLPLRSVERHHQPRAFV